MSMILRDFRCRWRLRNRILGALLVIALAPVHTVPAIAASPSDATAAGPIPPQVLRDWERRMVEYGKQAGEYLNAHSNFSLRLNAQYYDGQWVFLRIAQYTGDRQPWTRYAKLAGDIYKRYLSRNDFRAMGYRKFPHGLYVDWKLNGDEESRRHLLQMYKNSPFSDPFSGYADDWYQQRRSREIAYAIETQILAQKAGAPRKPQRMRRLVDMAIQHIETWATGNYRNSNPQQQFCKPFMAGLTASALISYYEYSVELGTPDERIPEMVQWLADWLWSEMWIANVNGTGHGAFEYVQPAVKGIGGNGPAPDLSLLIAPMYGWLYYHTGNPVYARRGDQIFAGGVALADLGHGKRFNQNYRSSFDYVMWRTAGRPATDASRPIDPTVAWAPDGS